MTSVIGVNEENRHGHGFLIPARDVDSWQWEGISMIPLFAQRDMVTTR
jgi:hypothetical protein